MNRNQRKYLVLCGLLGILVIWGGLGYKRWIGQTNFTNDFVTTDENLPEAQVSSEVSLDDGATYELRVSMVRKLIGGKELTMMAYNGMIPGPTIRIKKGSHITVKFINNLSIDTTLHSHGIRLDNRFDGVPDITQKPIKPGESFTYELSFPDEGVYWYHPHIREDYTQELGLYGNFLVDSDNPDYWSKVDREEMLFVDDMLLGENGIASFSQNSVNHTLMGRFGNTMLVNGMDNYSLDVKQGDIVRFYITNAANTRVFNLSIPGAKLKLVGGDNRKYEREMMVDSVIIAPSERYVVEALFDTAGEYSIMHTTPTTRYALGKVTVDEVGKHEPAVFEARVNQETILELNPYRIYSEKTPDKQLVLTMDGMSGGMGMMGGGMMSNGVTEDGIEWEDTMGMMNQQSSMGTFRWSLIDGDTRRKNMDMNWQFKVGDKVKIRIKNDANAMHSMQHPIHFHGQRFLVLDTDGVENANLVWKDTVLVRDNDTVDILLDVTNPGDWVIHCHIPEHMESGMMSEFRVY